MDEGPATKVDGAERGEMPSVLRDAAIRDSTARAPSNPLDDHLASKKISIQPEKQQQQQQQQYRAPNGTTSADVWSGAIARLQTQVSFNTSMLESQRRQLAECEASNGLLRQDIGSVAQSLERVRAEVRSRPPPTVVPDHHHPRHDPGDLSVLVEQVTSVTSKANEIDELKLQLKLMRNQMKRIEDQLAAAAAGGHAVPNIFRPEGIGPLSRRPSISQDHLHPPLSQHLPHQPPPHPQGPSPHMHPHQPPLPLPVQQQPPPMPPQLQQHVLPPTRPSVLDSPVESRSNSTHAIPSFPAVPVLHSQRSTDTAHSTPPQASPLDLTKQPPGPPNFRPAEQLPPPSSLSGWRPAEPMSHYPPPPPPPQQHHQALTPAPPLPGRPHAMEPDAHASGWAAVNANQPPKRPFDEPRQSPYGSPVSGSPKRPKLAPIMPRSMHGEDHPAGQNLPPPPAPPQPPPPPPPPPPNAVDGSFRPDPRVPPDAAAPPSMQNYPGAPGETQAYRFITSTSSGSTQDSSRPEHERILHVHPQLPGRGGRGGRRGGRGRGRGRGGQGQHLQHLGQRHDSPPDTEMYEWSGPPGAPVQAAAGGPPPPDGHYGQVHNYSPNHSHIGLSRGAPDGSHEHDGAGAGAGAGVPVTPVHHTGSPGTGARMIIPPSDIHLHQHPGGFGGMGGGSGNKKTRTKPIRNADGVLIRKDGRPDMRSVSSANNLRKVHAKKDIGGGFGADGEGDSKTPPPYNGHDVSDGADSTSASPDGSVDGAAKTDRARSASRTVGNASRKHSVEPRENEQEMRDAPEVDRRAKPPGASATPVPTADERNRGTLGAADVTMSERDEDSSRADAVSKTLAASAGQQQPLTSSDANVKPSGSPDVDMSDKPSAPAVAASAAAAAAAAAAPTTTPTTTTTTAAATTDDRPLGKRTRRSTMVEEREREKET